MEMGCKAEKGGNKLSERKSIVVNLRGLFKGFEEAEDLEQLTCPVKIHE